MAKGNQINLGAGCGLDTDEVVYWEHHEGVPGDSEPRTYVEFKSGCEVILRGDAKAAFDAWAESLRRAGERELCKTCGFRNVFYECKHDSEGATYPECFEDEDA